MKARIGDNQRVLLELIHQLGGAVHTNGLIQNTTSKIAGTASGLVRRGLLKHVDISGNSCSTFHRLSAKEFRTITKLHKKYPRAFSVWVLPSKYMGGEVTTTTNYIEPTQAGQTGYWEVPFGTL